MNLCSLRKYTDILLFFVMCFLAGTGLLIHYRLLPGSRGGHGLTFLGLSRHEWGDYHLWAAYLFTALIVFHVFVNFAFVKNIIASKKTWLLILLALAGSLILALFLLVPIERSQGGDHEGEHGEGHEQGHGRGRGIINGEFLPGEHGGREIHEEHEGRGPGKGQGQGRGAGRRRLEQNL